jgi:hypothetical protein
MKSCIQGSFISVPVPTELYVSLLDQLSKSAMDCDEPTAALTIVIKKYLDSARANRADQGDATPALGRLNDSITQRSPLTSRKSNTQKTAPGRNDWCIGCGCPAEELIV